MIQDLAESVRAMLASLGVTRLYAAVGASMGGMLALEYAAHFAEDVERMIMISASGRPGAISIGYRYVQRQVILSHPAYNGGWYYGNEAALAPAMSVARQIGNITYRSGREFNERFGRTRTGNGYNFGPDFEVESYLQHMGNKLSRDFDPNSFLFLTKAMDLYSLGYGFPIYEQGVARIRARALIVGVSTDMLFPYEEQQNVYQILKKEGRDATYRHLESTFGHDSFLAEVDFFQNTVGEFLAV
jgi:homoserine O-acetyltransferase